tara:strand:- start:1676 stop:7795 length:6120 start_codon:yes stop_codon:yes gene_type:complete
VSSETTAEFYHRARNDLLKAVDGGLDATEEAADYYLAKLNASRHGLAFVDAEDIRASQISDSLIEKEKKEEGRYTHSKTLTPQSADELGLHGQSSKGSSAGTQDVTIGPAFPVGASGEMPEKPANPLRGALSDLGISTEKYYSTLMEAKENNPAKFKSLMARIVSEVPVSLTEGDEAKANPIHISHPLEDMGLFDLKRAHGLQTHSVYSQMHRSLYMPREDGSIPVYDVEDEMDKLEARHTKSGRQAPHNREGVLGPWRKKTNGTSLSTMYDNAYKDWQQMYKDVFKVESGKDSDEVSQRRQFALHTEYANMGYNPWNFLYNSENGKFTPEGEPPSTPDDVFGRLGPLGWLSGMEMLGVIRHPTEGEGDFYESDSRGIGDKGERDKPVRFLREGGDARINALARLFFEDDNGDIYHLQDKGGNARGFLRRIGAQRAVAIEHALTRPFMGTGTAILPRYHDEMSSARAGKGEKDEEEEPHSDLVHSALENVYSDDGNASLRSQIIERHMENTGEKNPMNALPEADGSIGDGATPDKELMQSYVEQGLLDDEQFTQIMDDVKHNRKRSSSNRRAIEDHHHMLIHPYQPNLDKPHDIERDGTSDIEYSETPAHVYHAPLMSQGGFNMSGPALLPALGDMFGSLMVSEHFKDLPSVPAYRDEDDPHSMSADEGLSAGAKTEEMRMGGRRHLTATHTDFSPFISDLGWLSEIGGKTVGLADEQNVARRMTSRPDGFPAFNIVTLNPKTAHVEGARAISHTGQSGGPTGGLSRHYGQRKRSGERYEGHRERLDAIGRVINSAGGTGGMGSAGAHGGRREPRSTQLEESAPGMFSLIMHMFGPHVPTSFDRSDEVENIKKNMLHMVNDPDHEGWGDVFPLFRGRRAQFDNPDGAEQTLGEILSEAGITHQPKKERENEQRTGAEKADDFGVGVYALSALRDGISKMMKGEDGINDIISSLQQEFHGFDENEEHIREAAPDNMRSALQYMLDEHGESMTGMSRDDVERMLEHDEEGDDMGVQHFYDEDMLYPPESFGDNPFHTPVSASMDPADEPLSHITQFKTKDGANLAVLPSKHTLLEDLYSQLSQSDSIDDDKKRLLMSSIADEMLNSAPRHDWEKESSVGKYRNAQNQRLVAGALDAHYASVPFSKALLAIAEKKHPEAFKTTEDKLHHIGYLWGAGQKLLLSMSKGQREEWAEGMRGDVDDEILDGIINPMSHIPRQNMRAHGTDLASTAKQVRDAGGRADRTSTLNEVLNGYHPMDGEEPINQLLDQIKTLGGGDFIKGMKKRYGELSEVKSNQMKGLKLDAGHQGGEWNQHHTFAVPRGTPIAGFDSVIDELNGLAQLIAPYNNKGGDIGRVRLIGRPGKDHKKFNRAYNDILTRAGEEPRVVRNTTYNTERVPLGRPTPNSHVPMPLATSGALVRLGGRDVSLKFAVDSQMGLPDIVPTGPAHRRIMIPEVPWLRDIKDDLEPAPMGVESQVGSTQLHPEPISAMRDMDRQRANVPIEQEPVSGNQSEINDGLFNASIDMLTIDGDALLKSKDGRPPPIKAMHRIFSLGDLSRLRGLSGDWVVSIWPKGRRLIIKRKGSHMSARDARGENIHIEGEIRAGLRESYDSSFIIDVIEKENGDLFVVDLLENKGEETYNEPLRNRIRHLRAEFKSTERVTFPAPINMRRTDDEGLDTAIGELKKEGENEILLRDASATYMKGESRHPKWVLFSCEKSLDVIVLGRKGRDPYKYRVGIGPIYDDEHITALGNRAMKIEGHHYMDVGVAQSGERFGVGEYILIGVSGVSKRQRKKHPVYTLQNAEVKRPSETTASDTIESLSNLSDEQETVSHRVSLTKSGLVIELPSIDDEVIYQIQKENNTWFISDPFVNEGGLSGEESYALRLSEHSRPYWSPLAAILLKAAEDTKKIEDEPPANHDKKPKKMGKDHLLKDPDMMKALNQALHLIERVLKEKMTWTGPKGMGFNIGEDPSTSPTGGTELMSPSTLPDFAPDTQERGTEEQKKKKNGAKKKKVSLKTENGERGTIEENSESANLVLDDAFS